MTTDEAMMELDDAAAVCTLASNVAEAWKVIRAALADATARAERLQRERDAMRGRMASAVDAGARLLGTSCIEAFWTVANAAANLDAPATGEGRG